MASHGIGPLVIFDRPLRDEELPTLARLDPEEWAIDMELSPARAAAEITDAPLWRSEQYGIRRVSRPVPWHPEG